MPKSFDWDDLRFFLAVARSGTISGAGQRLATDHATVGRRITGLEAALGAKLFERNPRGYNLTQPGERLLASAQSIEAEALKAERDVADADLAVAGTVRISTLEGFGNFFLAGRLPRFAQANPNLAVELIAIQQIVALSRRESDIAVTLDPPQSGRFVRELLTEYVLFVYGARTYLAAHPPIATRADLAGHTFVGYIDDLVFMRGLDYLDEVGGRRIKARVQSSSLHAQMEATLSGHGLCVLPAFMAARHPELTRVLPGDICLRRSYSLVTHADVAETARVRAARRFIREEVEAASDLFLGRSPTHHPKGPS
ncbi:LysR family transcriptional regulator [Methylobacterium sp. Leaf399]|uniref:LysR family transcriptional regulator n=1 Tax=Methylobacterium sp. Leaf399 TaxID=1736364 RepID=UPI0006FE5DF0|nr:LysR family transcriptional regulator [Methylobacterium sp. Leaf399]KQT10066.1 LysR family transcriptional regulator [Methylobacterium sp. Leaf399]